MAALIDTMSRFILARGMALSSLTAARTCMRRVWERRGTFREMHGAFKEIEMDAVSEQTPVCKEGAGDGDEGNAWV